MSLNVIQNQNKKRLKDMVSPFNIDTKINILALLSASFAAFVGFSLFKPTDQIQWALKILEVISIFLAAYAITSIVKKFISNKQVEMEKNRLEQIAKNRKQTLDEFFKTQIDEVTNSIEKWAKIHKVNYKKLDYSKYKHTIDFKDFIIDYIDIHIANYQLLFTVRICEDSIIKGLLNYMSNSEIKIALVMDNNCIGPEAKIKINADNLCKVKSTLIDSILNPIHTKLYL